MKDIDFKLGDIVRWRDSKMSQDYDFGMVIKEPHIITGGVYSMADHLADIMDSIDDTFVMAEPLSALTVFSFREQRVVVLYRNPEDLPLYIEKVTFSEKSP